ncbi:MAG: acyl-ACP--UDP-N-acetylglucosamine O-acyltransferase [Candidatus Omnitrophota bacterium]
MEKIKIHPTAILEQGAQLASGVEVGPFSIIKKNVTIGERTKVGDRVTIEGWTTIGEDCEIFTGAVIGSITQDKKFKGGKSYLRIGNRNKIREYVTMNPGTGDGTETVVGDDNLLMAYSHVAHDCTIHNNATLANVATLAGHVIVEDRAIIGGLSAVHQFVRIGTLSIVGGCSKVVQDIPPYIMTDGHPVRAYGLNSVGLERAHIPKEERTELKKAFKIIFKSKLTLKNAILKIEQDVQKTPTINTLLVFLKKSERGICK